MSCELDDQKPSDIVDVCGAPIAVTNLDKAIRRIDRLVTEPGGHYICVADVHSVMRARTSHAHAEALRAADMVTPDGAPIVFFARARGYDVSRVCGPDLFHAICQESLTRKWSHFFYGAAPGVAKELGRRIGEQYPGINIVGTFSPPNRAIGDPVDLTEMALVRAGNPTFVWVGLGCPKQEVWMHNAVAHLGSSTLIGVGAVFDYYGGSLGRAPGWMARNGLEWLFRLTKDPRRLWRRYLLLGPQFLVLSLIQAIKEQDRSVVLRASRR